MRSAFQFFVWIALLTLQVNSQLQNNQIRFKSELFLNDNDQVSGLYEGEVVGSRRFDDKQVPDGYGTIYYFTTDPFGRKNYTGDWKNGTREGNGTTFWQDGSYYVGQYKNGVEEGSGRVTYANGNSLQAEFSAGAIEGHGVFRYANGDQREGFFARNVLTGQVIFTRSDGVTFIETWENGQKISGGSSNEIIEDSQNSANDDQESINGEETFKDISKFERSGNKRISFSPTLQEISSSSGEEREYVVEARKRESGFLQQIYDLIS